MFRHFTVPFLLMLFVCADVNAQPLRQGISKHPVTLNFDWPVDLSLRAAMYRTKSEKSASIDYHQNIEGWYTLRTKKHANGLLVTREDPKFNYRVAKGREISKEEKLMQTFLIESAAKMPDYVVDLEGHILSIEALDEFIQRMKASAEAWAKDLTPLLKKQAPFVIEQLTNPDVVRSSLQFEWHKLVQQWAGKTVQQDINYSSTSKAAFESLEHISIDVIETRRLTQVSCPVEGARKVMPKRCVLLSYSYRMDPKAFEPLKAQYLSSMKDSRKDILSATSEYHSELLVDPETMIPYSLKERNEEKIHVTYGTQMDRNYSRVVETNTLFERQGN